MVDDQVRVSIDLERTEMVLMKSVRDFFATREVKIEEMVRAALENYEETFGQTIRARVHREVQTLTESYIRRIVSRFFEENEIPKKIEKIIVKELNK